MGRSQMASEVRRRMRLQGTLALGIGLVLTAALSGCTAPFQSSPTAGVPSIAPATDSPVSTPPSTPTTPTPTPTPPETAAADDAETPVLSGPSIVIGSRSFTVTTSRGTSTIVKYSSTPSAAKAALASVLNDTPAKSERAPAEMCIPGYTELAWKGLSLYVQYDFLPEGQNFSISASEPVIDGVSIVDATNGFSVGDDTGDLIDSLPTSQVLDYTRYGITEIFVAIDPVVSASEAESADDGMHPRPGWGTELVVVDSVVTVVQAPILYDASGGC